MPKDLKIPYLLIAFTFGVAGVSGLASGQGSMLAFVVLAAVFVWLSFNEGEQQKHSRRRD